MTIQEITLRIGAKETIRVGDQYVPGHPEQGTVASIQRTPSGSYHVYNQAGGYTAYVAHYVDPDSVVEV